MAVAPKRVSPRNTVLGFEAHLRGLPDDALAHREDVHSAYRAATGEPEAVAALEEEVLGPLRDKLARRYGASTVDEALQRVRERLLVGREGRPGLLEYEGRGPLAAWVHAVAVRAVQDVLRAGQRAALRPELEEEPLGLSQLHPELALIKSRYAEDVAAAIQQALGELERRERVLLRLSLVSGLSVDQLARVYHVHKSTAARWVADAKRHVLEATLLLLRERLGLSPSEAQSLMRTVQSQVEVSIRRLL